MAISTINTSSISSLGYGFKNRIINGAMMIDQRNAGASVTQTTAFPYLVDRWSIGGSVTSKFSAQQVVDAPTGFLNSVKVTSLSAYTPGANEEYDFRQAIEANNMQDLAWGTASAATITMSFWVKSSLTGTFGGALYNYAGTYSYPFTYTINSANTWEQKTITIAGPTAGSWNTGNTGFVWVVFSMGIGSGRNGTAGAWSSNYYAGATGQTNIVATNAATWQITGVQFEAGVIATSFDYRPYGTELTLCLRYYYKEQATTATHIFGETGYANSATAGAALGHFPVTMRTAPTALEQSGTASQYTLQTGGVDRVNSAVLTFANATTNSWRVTTTVASGQTAGYAGFLYGNSTSAYLAWSAEL